MESRSRFGRQIIDEVGSWFGVSASLGRRGEIRFKVNRHEIGYLDSGNAAFFRFEGPLRAQLRHAGRVADHPLFPQGAGPLVRRISSEEDARDVVRLLWINYELAIARFNRRAERAAMPAMAARMVAN
ncbi:luciferase family protein [Mesorhizobium sp. Z1-4]|uniref:luciferase domain-containing protein n=1 Tax=Mesorhizobium sp. Z1-4 TaxID=2448478 RepID=UPI000FD9F3AF|nr:luciferase family protein [Mesorhizobium sp. Z1-4]